MNRPLAAAALAAVTLAAFLLVMGMLAHAAGWSDDLQMQKWFAEAPVKKCCSLADGFEADIFENTRDGGVWVIITDDGAPASAPSSSSSSPWLRARLARS